MFFSRLFPLQAWADEIVRDEALYAAPRDVEWLSGACLLVRRSLLESIGRLGRVVLPLQRGHAALQGRLGHRCARAIRAGRPSSTSAVRRHRGTAPRDARVVAALCPGGTRPGSIAFAQRVGIGLEAVTHILVCSGGLEQRLGHARALRAVVTKTSASARGSRASARRYDLQATVAYLVGGVRTYVKMAPPDPRDDRPRAQFRHVVINTGGILRSRNVDALFEELGIGAPTSSSASGRAVTALRRHAALSESRVLCRNQAVALIVPGDVNSTLAGRSPRARHGVRFHTWRQGLDVSTDRCPRKMNQLLPTTVRPGAHTAQRRL